MTGPLSTPTGTIAPITHPPQWPVYNDDARAAAAELIAAGRTFDYGYGPELASFESDFARRHERSHALAVASGTAALLAAYSALGFGPGDEVIVPDYTFFSTASPLFLLGAVPVLADAREPEGTVDPAAVAALIGPRTVGIVATHLWGHPADLPALGAIAGRHGLALVEDCSHAHGSTINGEPVGKHSDMAVFSVGGHKAVSGGMGGILLTDSADLFAKACLLANFRHRTDLTIDLPAYEPFLQTGIGGNFRMSPVAAVLAHSHLTELDRRVSARITNISTLIQHIECHQGVRAVPTRAGCTMGAWYDAVIDITEESRLARDELVARLKPLGLDVRAPATRPLHTYPIFRGAAPAWNRPAAAAVAASGGRNNREFPYAARMFQRWLRLPVNFLWDDDGVIVEPYAAAFDQVLGPALPPVEAG